MTTIKLNREQNRGSQGVKKNMVKGYKIFKKLLKWYGLPIGMIIGNLSSDYSFQIFGVCVLLGYLAGSFIYITDDKD